MRGIALGTTAAALALLALGCSSGSTGEPAAGPTTGAGAAPTGTAYAAPAAPGTCPLTLANRSTPPDVPDWPPSQSFGNGKIWTQFWPHNVLVVTSDYVDENGAIGMKWPWWRGVRGRLRLEGRRLDGEAGPITADIPGGYGPRGFQPSGITFPTEGCWEVTGSVGDVRLTFVTLVLKASTYSLRSDLG